MAERGVIPRAMAPSAYTDYEYIRGMVYVNVGRDVAERLLNQASRQEDVRNGGPGSGCRGPTCGRKPRGGTLSPEIFKERTVMVHTLWHTSRDKAPTTLTPEHGAKWGHGGTFFTNTLDNSIGDHQLRIRGDFKIFDIQDQKNGSFDILRGYTDDAGYLEVAKEAAREAGLPDGPPWDLPPKRFGIEYFKDFSAKLKGILEERGFDGWWMGGELVVWNYDKLNKGLEVYNSAMTDDGWVAVDLDGTLAYSDGTFDGSIGDPIPARIERVKQWLAKDIVVKIFTARASDPDQHQMITEWLLLQGLPALPVVNYKDRNTISIFDDRAYHAEPNTDEDFVLNIGGPGSGNWGHAGRPGQVGGSAKKSFKGPASTSDILGGSLFPKWTSKPESKPEPPSIPDFSQSDPAFRQKNESMAHEFRQWAREGKISKLTSVPRQPNKALDKYVDDLIAFIKPKQGAGYGSWSKPKTKSAGAVVYNDQGQVALIAPKGSFGGYTWSWPKGGIELEKEENPESAAHREVAEEAGIDGDIEDDLGEHEGTTTFTQYYLMKHTKSGLKMDQETAEVRWVKPEEAADLLDNVRDLRVLVKAMSAMAKRTKVPPLSV